MPKTIHATASFARIALTALPVLLALALPAAAAGAVPAGAAAQEPDSLAQFKKDYEQALKVNAKAEMARLMKRQTEHAINLIMVTCEDISNGTSEELETLMAGLRVGWNEAFGTKFANEVYEYFSLLDPVAKRARQDLIRKRTPVMGRFQAALAKKDGPGFELVGAELRAIAEGFEELGDHYNASAAWYNYAICFDKAQRGKEADFGKAAEGFRRCIENREAIGLKDSQYAIAKQNYDFYKAQGIEGEAPAGGAGGDASAAPSEPTSPAIVAEMRFEVLEEPGELRRISWFADELYAAWKSLPLAGRGSTATFSGMEDSPQVHRTGAAEVRVDLDGSGDATGEDDLELQLGGRIEPFSFEVGAGDTRRQVAYFTMTGGDRDTYQGMQMNLAPTDDAYTVYFLPAGSMVGEIAGTEVRVIDDNSDGLYGSPSQSWGHIGLSPDMYQPELDSVVIGGGKEALPWSEYMQIAGQWYKLESEAAGKRLKATPVEVPTGKLKLDFDGGKPTYLVVRGSGSWENSFFDLVAGGSGGVDVPVGTYSLYAGDLRKGKKQQTSKAAILSGPGTRTWTVLAGETTTVELGEPFGFDFRHTLEGDQLTVHGETVVVTGRAGERYERTWNAVPRPEVSWREAGSRRGSRGEEMDVVLSQDQITELGWRAAWSPLDLVLEVDPGLEAVEVQLVEKKNKLFGKVESDWK